MQTSKVKGAYGNYIPVVDHQSDCGKPLESVRGVSACSNANLSYSGYSCGGETWLGFRYQCVELIRRWLITKWGHHDSYGNAKDWWASMEYSSFFYTFGNGETRSLPQEGDILVWTGGTWGHIGLIGNVIMETPSTGYVVLLQQNMLIGTEHLPLTVDQNGLVSITAGGNAGGVSSDPRGWGRPNEPMVHPDAEGPCPTTGLNGSPVDMSPEERAAWEAEQQRILQEKNQKLSELYAAAQSTGNAACEQIYQTFGNAINECEKHPQYNNINTKASRQINGKDVVRICGDYAYNKLPKPFWVVCDQGAIEGNLGRHDSCAGDTGLSCLASASETIDPTGPVFDPTHADIIDLPEVQGLCESLMRNMPGLQEKKLCYRINIDGQAKLTNWMMHCTQNQSYDGEADPNYNWSELQKWYRCSEACDDSSGEPVCQNAVEVNQHDAISTEIDSSGHPADEEEIADQNSLSPLCQKCPNPAYAKSDCLNNIAPNWGYWNTCKPKDRNDPALVFGDQAMIHCKPHSQHWVICASRCEVNPRTPSDDYCASSEFVNCSTDCQ